jgi:hypothetical protein
MKAGDHEEEQQLTDEKERWEHDADNEHRKKQGKPDIALADAHVFSGLAFFPNIGGGSLAVNPSSPRQPEDSGMSFRL